MSEINIKAEEQAKALIDACISIIIAEGDHMTYQDFIDWIDGTIQNFSHDEDWLEDIEDFKLDMQFIKKNDKKVYGYIFVNM